MRARYPVAILVTLLALLLRLGAGHWFAASSPFLFFTPAVMFAAWYGGRGPGLLVTAAGALLINYFLIAPFRNFSMSGDDLTRMILFISVGVQISWLSGAMYTARNRAEADAVSARRSERLYRTLASNFPDGFVCLFDNQLRWTLVAGGGLEVAGLSRAAMEGTPIITSLPAETGLSVNELCARVATGQAAEGEITHLNRVYFCHAIPLRLDEDADAIGMAILEDVTERAKARQALQWAHDNLERRVRERTAELRFQKTLLESLSQASADGMLAVGNDGRITFANRRFEEIWRLEGVDQMNHLNDVRDQLRPLVESAEDPLSIENASLTLEDDHSEEISLRDGRTLGRYSAAIVDRDGTNYGRVWFFSDVTEARRLQREVLEAGEHERHRIGQDLHDDLCQQLSGIACMAHVLELTMRNTHAPVDRLGWAHAISDIVAMVNRANQRARDLAKGLQPINLLTQGLPAALQELCNSIQDIFKVNCVFGGLDAIADLPESVSIHLYRIAQEAINNAVRHGHARSIKIDLLAATERLILTVEDDGVGIPDPPPANGLGLYTMTYRARMAGGNLTIEPASPHGTIVTCAVNLRINHLSSRTGDRTLVGEDDGADNQPVPMI